MNQLKIHAERILVVVGIAMFIGLVWFSCQTTLITASWSMFP